MNFTTKFNIGDFVFRIIDEKVQGDCDICLGTSILYNKNGDKFDCNDCRNGITTVGRRYIVSSGLWNIVNITITEWKKEDPVLILYGIAILPGSSRDFLFSEERLFITKEEAQAECDRLNSLDKSKD